MSIIIRQPADIETLAKRVRDVFSGKPLELVLREYKPPRSIDQNARLWMLHRITAEHLNQALMNALEHNTDPVIVLALKQPWTAELVHARLYKPQFLGGRSSTRRNKMETVDDQTAYEAWMVSIGIQFDTQYGEASNAW